MPTLCGEITCTHGEANDHVGKGSLGGCTTACLEDIAIPDKYSNATVGNAIGPGVILG